MGKVVGLRMKSPDGSRGGNTYYSYYYMQIHYPQ